MTELYQNWQVLVSIKDVRIVHLVESLQEEENFYRFNNGVDEFGYEQSKVLVKSNYKLDNMMSSLFGRKYRHTNGNIYAIIGFSNLRSEKEKYKPTVIYTNVENGSVWSRPLEDWNRSMTLITDE